MYENKTPEAIKAAMLGEIRAGMGLSALAGGFADGVTGPVAEQLSQCYMSLDAVPDMLFPDESCGAYIDQVGEQYYAITRRAGTYARCTMAFTGKGGLVIPAGTVFLTAGGLAFALQETVTLGSGGTGSGQLQAREVGSAYNVDAGTIDRMYVNLTGLTSYRNEAAQGGTDPESDAALLERIRERVQRPPTSGNGYQYQQWCLEVEGVGWAKVVELAQGPGTVGLTLVDSTGAPASEEMVEAVRAHVEESRPIGAAVTVDAAQTLEITVAAQVTLSGVSASQVEEALTGQLDAYRRTLIDAKFSRIYYGPEEDQPYTMLYNRLLAMLLNLDGVEDFSSLTLNGGTANLSIPAASVPVLGEVTVTA